MSTETVEELTIFDELTEGSTVESQKLRFPRPFPVNIGVSGLYTSKSKFASPLPFPRPIRAISSALSQSSNSRISDQLPTDDLEGDLTQFEVTSDFWWFDRDELRLDVDGCYPLLTASGSIKRFLRTRVHWIASLQSLGRNSWRGDIWYKDGDVETLPHTHVRITVAGSIFSTTRKAIVTFSGGGAQRRVRKLEFDSPYFHKVEFEFDHANNTNVVSSIETHDHPNRPPNLPNERLTIEKVYRRAGFKVRPLPIGQVPIEDAGGNARWSDAEMHDAMQVYWSKFADKSQWSMWVFFAALHERGNSLGGIMFDDIGPNHRQGTAIFNDSFISQAPQGDANPNAFISRMRFWTACHEMGHSFNLAHSWQKQHPSSWGSSWIPLTNEPEARSFMNYPYNVSGGQTAFFSDFEFRFSDGELLFMRHAPARFVQMGNADWFDDHGFEQANVREESVFALEVRLNRKHSRFEFLEPIVVELKLTNTSHQPVLIDEELLSMQEHMTVIIKKDGKPARQFSPFVQYCLEEKKKVLSPGEPCYESLFVSVGKNGWDLSEPGHYTISICLHLHDEDVVSNSMNLCILPPLKREEEVIAQDYFSQDVGRILTFDGSVTLESGLNTLRKLVDSLKKSNAALHAKIALASPLRQSYRVLHVNGHRRAMTSASDAKAEIRVHETQPDEAHTQLASALADDPNSAATSLGHIDYKWYMDKYSNWLFEIGKKDIAQDMQSVLHMELSTRKVLPRILKEIKDRRDSYKKGK